MISEEDNKLQKEIFKLHSCLSEFTELRKLVPKNTNFKNFDGNDAEPLDNLMKIEDKLHKLAKELQIVMMQLKTKINHLTLENKKEYL